MMKGLVNMARHFVWETVKLMHSEAKHKEAFFAVLMNHLESTICFKSSAINNVFNEFMSKLTNTRIQEFLDFFKATRRGQLLYLDKI